LLPSELEMADGSPTLGLSTGLAISKDIVVADILGAWRLGKAAHIT
jgi:hypothetical protein